MEDEAQCKTLVDKPVAVKVEEEDLAIWELADKAEGAAQEVMVAAVVAMVAGRAAVEVEMVAAVVTEAEDATVEAVVTEVVDLEWEEACLGLVKVVLHNQKRKSGMQAYLIP